jgi:diguanylate cyclase (GGDEF)-like protein
MKKILIIDDDKIYAKNLKKSILKDTTIQSVTIVNSVTELEQIDIKQFDLIISDIFMENYNEEYIKENIISKNIPVIVTTGFPDKVIKEKLQKLNIVDFIIKTDSIKFNQIIDKIKILNYLEKYSILIVDDSKTSLLINIKILKKYYPFTKILVAENAKKALEKIEEYKNIKLIITDYEMPQMSGAELIRNIRKTYDIDQKIIIAISGIEDKQTASILLKIGANDFLYKPVSEEELMCRIDNNIKIMLLIDKIKNIAYKDILTNLFNRRYCFETVNKLFLTAKKENKPVTILMCDIDNFKNINDTYGHQTGDIIIQETAKIIQNSIKKNDIACRYGGEEFAVFLYDYNLTLATLIAEKIKKTIEFSTITDKENNKIRYTISIGISNKGNSLEDMIKNADKMLYKAKETKNKIIVDKKQGE